MVAAQESSPGAPLSPSRRKPGGAAGLRARLAAGVRRGLVVGTGAALAAGVLAGVSTGQQQVPASATEPSALRSVAASSVAPLRTFSLNVAFSLGIAQARSDMGKAVTQLGASVGGFQEISQPQDRASLIDLLKKHNWGWFVPASNGRPLPVVWDRDRFDLVSGKSFTVHGPVGPTPARYINVVRLRETATGLDYGIINTHTIPGASRDAQASNMTRIPYLRRHLQMLRAEMLELRAETEQVVAMGDLNVNYLADRRRQVAGLPTDALGDIVDFDMPLEGSRGPKSLLDYTMTMQNGSLDKTAGSIVRGFNSDHDAVVITYDVDASGAPTPSPEADPEPDPKPEPKPEAVFESGPVTNTLGGSAGAARAVLDAWARAIKAARPGTTVRAATPRLRDERVARTLLAADQRGVRVQMLTARGARTYWERRLARDLGKGSWLRGARSASRASFLLVARAGGTPTVTLSTSAPLTPYFATKALANAYQATDAETFAAFGSAFRALKVGSVADARRIDEPVAGGLKVSFGPLPGGRRDPVARDIRPIRCSATSPRTANGRTKVRVAVSAWRGGRGLVLARLLAKRSSWGCDVRVLSGPGMGSTVRRVLRRSGVDVRRAPLGETLLLVDGRYGQDRDAQLSWTGTGTFDPSGLRGVSQTVFSPETVTHDAYRQQFERQWRRS